MSVNDRGSIRTFREVSNASKRTLAFIYVVRRAPGNTSLPAPASAQTLASGTIAGVARDASSAVLPGVNVEVSSPALIEKSRTVVTDAQGQSRVVDLRPGTYTIVFTLPGFTTYRREAIELTSGFTATVNAELKVGSIEETVTVSGASPIVDVQNVAQQNVLGQEQLDALPTFKNLQGIGVLTVGASTTGGHDVGGTRSEIYSSITIHGSKVEDARMDMDGMRYQNMWGIGGGLSRLWFLNSNIVQEMVVETSGMSAEAENGGPVGTPSPRTAATDSRPTRTTRSPTPTCRTKTSTMSSAPAECSSSPRR